MFILHCEIEIVGLIVDPGAHNQIWSSITVIIENRKKIDQLIDVDITNHIKSRWFVTEEENFLNETLKNSLKV